MDENNNYDFDKSPKKIIQRSKDLLNWMNKYFNLGMDDDKIISLSEGLNVDPDWYEKDKEKSNNLDKLLEENK
jgi:hypothetical protein